MTGQAYRRSILTLYTEAGDLLGHAVRLVLAEKDVTADVQFVTEETKPEDLNDLNPYRKILTLIDRDLVLYDASIMLEFLDERYPHPPLMPMDPVSRASNRQLRHRIARELLEVGNLLKRKDDSAAKAAKIVTDNLNAIAPAFAQRKFFFSDEYSLVDCCLAPLLWRLPEFGIKLGAQAKPLLRYADILFARDAFRASLTPSERQARPRP